VTQLFRQLDKDFSGALDYVEMKEAFSAPRGGMPGLELSQEDWAQVLLHMDTDGNGEIELNEFLTAMGCFSKSQFQRPKGKANLQAIAGAKKKAEER